MNDNDEKRQAVPATASALGVTWMVRKRRDSLLKMFHFDCSNSNYFSSLNYNRN